MKYKFVYDWDTTDILGYPSLNSNGITKRNFELALTEIPVLRQYSEYQSIIRSSMVLHGELKSHEPYVYCLPVGNHIYGFIPKFDNRLEIPLHIRHDVLSGRAVVLIDYVYEGMLYLNSYQKFCEVVSTIQLPRDRVVVRHGDFVTDKFENLLFSYEPHDIFPVWLPQSPSPIDYVPEKLFVTYNRRPRLHRLILIANLIKNNLIEDGISSLGTYNHNVKNLGSIDGTLTPIDCEKLSDYVSYSPDGVNLEVENPANTINIEHHRRSFVSLVSETLVENNVSFFSEKIYKPLSIGHPFILVGNPHSLSRLHSLGYKTFSKYWDESYDVELDWVTRIHKIMSILQQLQKLSDGEKISMRQDMNSILVHNQKTFIQHNIQTETSWNLHLFEKYLT